MIGACPPRSRRAASDGDDWTVQGNLNGEESNMRSWLRIGILGAGALAVMLGPLWTVPASGQVAERRKVMVTNLVPRNGANDDFGKDLAKELRDLINDLGTHQAVEEKEIRNAAKKYDLDMDELDCIRSLQLSGQLRANIVFCGEYTEDKRAKTFTLTGIQFAHSSSAPLEIPDKTWPKDQEKAAAQEIAQLFGQFIERLRDAVNCGDYYNTGEWESAERNCKDVLAQAPDDSQVRLILAPGLPQDRPARGGARRGSQGHRTRSPERGRASVGRLAGHHPRSSGRGTCAQQDVSSAEPGRREYPDADRLRPGPGG